MASFSPTDYANFLGLKFQQKWGYGLTRHRSVLFRIFDRGTESGKLKDVPTAFGRAAVFAQVSGYGSSPGLPDASGSLEGIGDENEDVNQVGITPWFIFPRAKADVKEFKLMQSSEAAYVNGTMKRMKDMINGFAHWFSSVHYGTGRGMQMTQVTAAGGGVLVDSASTEFTVEVPNVSAVPQNASFIFVNADWSDISNMGRCVMLGPGSAVDGPGTIRFRCPGYTGSSFTVPNNARIVTMNAHAGGTNLGFVNGLVDMVGEGPHPRSEGANIQSSNPYYASPITPIAAGKASVDDVVGLFRKIKLRGQTYQELDFTAQGIGGEKFDKDGRPVRQKFFALMHPSVRDYFAFKLRTSGSVHYQVQPGVLGPQVFDEGFACDTIMGVPILEDALCPTDVIYVLNVEAIGKMVLSPFGALPKSNGDWERMSGKVGYELVRMFAAAYLPIARDCMGKIIQTGGGTFALTDEEVRNAA